MFFFNVTERQVRFFSNKERFKQNCTYVFPEIDKNFSGSTESLTHQCSEAFHVIRRQTFISFFFKIISTLSEIYTILILHWLVLKFWQQTVKFQSLNFVKLNWATFKRHPSSFGIPLDYGVKRILNFYDLLQGHGAQKAVLVNQNEWSSANRFADSSLTAETLLHELSNVFRKNVSHQLDP